MIWLLLVILGAGLIGFSHWLGWQEEKERDEEMVALLGRVERLERFIGPDVRVVSGGVDVEFMDGERITLTAMQTETKGD
jgi:hypothetical protein